MIENSTRGDRAKAPLSSDWLGGGGEMGELLRAKDWVKTPLGPPESWPQSLRTAISILLNSRYPMFLAWGPELAFIYNDGYRPILGDKHPAALGRPFAQLWSEIWSDIGPLVDRALLGEATYSENLLLVMKRRGFPEETYFTFSYSPVRDESGGIGGMFCACFETTEQVIGERRLRTLSAIASGVREASDAASACEIAASKIVHNTADFPFALIYLLDDSGVATLAASAGLTLGHAAAPATIDLESGAGPWPLASVAARERAQIVHDLGAVGQLPGGPWVDPATDAVVFPLFAPAPARVTGFLVAGLNRRRPYDDTYAAFFDQIAGHIAAAIANARAYEEERKRAEALAEIDRAKTAFFSNVSHEFRTPLTLMLGPLEDLKEEFGRSADSLSVPQYQQIDLVHRSGLRLLKLVNTLLDFSRIEAGRVQAVYEPTDLAGYTADLASVFRAATEKAGLKLAVECPAMPESAFIDREMWEKIVLNLVSNAFKYTFEGEIGVKLCGTETHFELSVRDTGTGIPQDELPKIFERFHRVAGSQGRTHEGSGIGLALVQELVRLHGGSVSVESDYGKGSTFRVLIPKGHGHLPATQIGAERTQVSTALGSSPFVEEALRWLPAGSDQNGRDTDDAGIPQQPGSESGRRPRVLLADDNADMRDYVRRLLVPHYDVETVADGEAVLAAIGRILPDLVVSDVMMPRIDGIELVKRLRAAPRTNTLPIILLSARAGEEAKVEGLAGGADDYLVKPFSARELLARVAASIGAAKVRRAIVESEKRFRTLADSAPALIWVNGLEGCEYINRGYLEFLGVGTEEVQGLGWQKFVHPDDRSEYVDAYSRAAGSRALFDAELRFRRHDGEYRWMQSVGQPRFGVDGAFLGYAGLTFDITERKQAEQAQQLLVSELNHRVKNTLAIVQAIVRHTLRRTKDPAEFAPTFAGRIQSLSRVHTILSNTNWRGADLRELIRDQLLLDSVDETRLTTRGPAVRLESQTALHMALMLHELVTNSIKHGALSKPQGRVTVNWTVDGDMLRLHWIERGGPPTAVPTLRGFGMTLIEQSIRGEGGDARMSVEAEGVAWEITLPLPRPASYKKAWQSSPTTEGSPSIREALAVQSAPPRLGGKRFLVIEDEPLVALDIVASLEEAGAEMVGSAGTVADAMRMIDSGTFDGALLDGNLHGEPVDEIAAALTRRKIPFIFVTGYGLAGLPRAFGNVAVVAKPFSQHQLIDAAAAMIGRRDDVRRLRK